MANGDNKYVTHTFLHEKFEQVRQIMDKTLEAMNKKIDDYIKRNDKEIERIRDDNISIKQHLADLRVEVANLSGQFKIWLVVAGILMGLISFALEKLYG